MPTAFQRDTAVSADPASPGRYLAHLPETWAAPNVAWGGISLATATRAMAEALPAPMPLRSVSCVFAAPVECGDAEIDVTVLRAGRSVAQATRHHAHPGPGRGPHRDRGLRHVAAGLRVHRRHATRVPARRLAAVVP